MALPPVFFVDGIDGDDMIDPVAPLGVRAPRPRNAAMLSRGRGRPRPQLALLPFLSPSGWTRTMPL